MTLKNMKVVTVIHKIGYKFNKLTNKKNEKLFEIVPYLNKDVPIISMIDENILNDENS